ncbi:MarR family winged helix-turn-helix transcriptional regulator [Jiangella anatolica]|uniref:MarR family transcriptional regulator n=1 Tax=Jiangella anatolica TaxID=2670374 RepID=A0A2W2AXA6_9ACTN|nr:MarR family transcriptional regulator [Jiangella anatolica]PZF79775.1 MarR family transcriptional regulator [Jiangella anatolica]
MSDSPRKHTEALGRILELVVVLSDDMTTSLAAQGLTDARAHLLWELHQRGPSTQRVLADALRVSPRNITGLVDALVATGFVTREPHPTDRRATLVSFTEHGAAVTAAMERDQHEFARILFADMPDDRFACLMEGLDDVLARLRAHGVSVETARTSPDPGSEAG